MGNVFGAEVVESIRTRYAATPEDKRPLLYWVACSTRGGPTRQKIEEWAAVLPERIFRRVTPRLLNPDGYRSTYGELMLMRWLTERGFRFDYERPLPNGKTPDLWVHRSARGPAFICEIYTEHLSPDIEAKHSRLTQVCAGLGAIPLDFRVSVSADPDWETRDDLDIPAVVEGIGAWLAERPEVGDRQRIGFLEVEVVLKGAGYESVKFQGPTIAWVVDGTRPWEKLQNKIKSDYTDFARRSCLALVVAYVTDFGSGTEPDTIADALLGNDVHTVLRDKGTGKVVGQWAKRSDDGLFQTVDRALSAVLAVSETVSGIDVAPFHNPNALTPLPERCFTRD